jgi:hypothetical protein
LKVFWRKIVLEVVDDVVDDFLGENTFHGGGDVLECNAGVPSSSLFSPDH